MTLHFRGRKLAALVFAGLTAVAMVGCKEDEFEASTWTKKLDDSKEVEQAVTQLERLGYSSAIPALGKAWEKQGRPERILRVIIDLARPLTKEEAKKDYKNYKNGDYQAREASWDKALPFLKKAIEEVDGANPRSIESARLAAEALGDSKIDGAFEALQTAANSATVRQLRLQALYSLGKLNDPRAVDVLANIIREDFDPTKPEVPGAAIIALGQLKSEKAVPVLVEAMYRLPFFFKQIRRALVASGGKVVSDRIGAILRKKDGDVNALFAEKQLDTYKGDLGKDPLPQAEWQKVSAMDYYAAIIAGDLYDPALVGPLLEALAREPVPAYFVDSAPGPSAHNAILDSLRKIGSAEAADEVLGVVTGKADELKPIAANVYSFVSKDGGESAGKENGLALLGKIAADNNADQNLRLEASVAYGRLASSKDKVPLLIELSKKYKEASDKAQAEADGAPKKAYEAAKATYDAAKQKLDEAKSAVSRAGGERKAPVELINKTTEAKVEFDKVKEPHTKARAAWKALDDKAKAYRGFQRVFESHVARIEIADHCKGKVECYAGTVDPAKKWQEQWDALAPRLKAISGGAIAVDKYTEEEKKEALAAQVERAMLELGKMGSKANSATATLLEAVKSDDRIIRQSILLALPKVAGKDCKECGAKLDAAIKAGDGKTTLGELNFETQVLRSYFAGDASDAPAEAESK